MKKYIAKMKRESSKLENYIKSTASAKRKASARKKSANASGFSSGLKASKSTNIIDKK